MKTFILICKGILLYTTIFLTLLYLCGIDSIYDNGYFIEGLLIIITLICICYNIISSEELEIILFNKRNK